MEIGRMVEWNVYSAEKRIHFIHFHPDPGQREKNNLNVYSHTFFVVPQKLL